MDKPLGMLAVIPSRLQVGETFSIKLKILGPIHKIPCAGNYRDWKPELYSPFNLNVCRQIQYHDNCLPEWSGKIVVDGGPSLTGPKNLIFDGIDQGVFPSDTRPIKEFCGFSFSEPGFHFISLVEPESGVAVWTNPVLVSEAEPEFRIYWGDPHWQTFFSDGIRCPEELYAFARNEAFLDFGAISDHMEAVTERQWDYFQLVTNDFNEPGRFVTLHGQEWTNHDPATGAPGHRNIYYRGHGGPALRSTDPECNTLKKLWLKLDSLKDIEVIAIPHHTANVVMGVDWEQGWNPEYEKAVEIYSVWGSSEKPASAGNTRPINSLKGEIAGRHIVDALKKGFDFGFVGGGDIHDGRPGDDLHPASYPPRPDNSSAYPQGFTAVRIPVLNRENVFDAIRDHRTYATTKNRAYLEVEALNSGQNKKVLAVTAASEQGIKEVAVVFNGEDIASLRPDSDPRVVQTRYTLQEFGPNDFCYLRIMTENGDMAWSSPVR